MDSATRAKTPTYPVICQFPLLCTIFDHNHQHYRQTDRQKSYAFGMSVTCCC